MFRFTIRDVLWLTAVAALGVGWGTDHWSMGRREASKFLDSSWVVCEAYVFGKPERGAVGWWIVVDGGRIVFVDKSIVESFEIGLLDAATEDRFALIQNGRPVGKALAITSENGTTTLYLNHALEGPAAVTDPVPDRDKCIETFVCLPIPEAVGRTRLDAARKGE